jgi:hypothetical protein
MQLAELQDRFSTLMRTPGPLDVPELGPADRLELYRSLVRGCLWGALESTYPLTQGQLEAFDGDLWRKLCLDFVREVASQPWDLNGWVVELAPYVRTHWLSRHPELPAWLGELAEYERAELEVYLAPSPAPDPESSVAGFDPQILRAHEVRTPRVNPTAQLLAFEHDIAGWVRADADEGSSPVPSPTFTLAYRDPETLQCRFLNLTPVTARVVEALADGQEAEAILTWLQPLTGLTDAAARAQLDAQIHQLLQARALE